MKKLPNSLINTWLFLVKSEDPQLAKSKVNAVKQIKQHFGNIELAQLYLEQSKDNSIEVILV